MTSFGRTTPSELPNFRTLSWTILSPLLSYYYCNNAGGARQANLSYFSRQSFSSSDLEVAPIVVLRHERTEQPYHNAFLPAFLAAAHLRFAVSDILFRAAAESLRLGFFPAVAPGRLPRLPLPADPSRAAIALLILSRCAVRSFK